MAGIKPKPHSYGSRKSGALAGTNTNAGTLPDGTIISRYILPKQKVVRTNRAVYLGGPVRKVNFKGVKAGIEAMKRRGMKPWGIFNALTKEGYGASIDPSKRQIIVYERYGQKAKKPISVPY